MVLRWPWLHRPSRHCAAAAHDGPAHLRCLCPPRPTQPPLTLTHPPPPPGPAKGGWSLPSRGAAGPAGSAGPPAPRWLRRPRTGPPPGSAVPGMPGRQCTCRGGGTDSNKVCLGWWGAWGGEWVGGVGSHRAASNNHWRALAPPAWQLAHSTCKQRPACYSTLCARLGTLPAACGRPALSNRRDNPQTPLHPLLRGLLGRGVLQHVRDNLRRALGCHQPPAIWRGDLQWNAGAWESGSRLGRRQPSPLHARVQTRPGQ